MTLSFFVPGRARPKGSKRAIPIYRGRKGEPRVFTGQTALVESAGDGLKQWEQAIRFAGAAAMSGQALLDGPLCLNLVFSLPKPKAARKDARWPIVRPDRLKLARAVEDALTGVVWRDDAQVVDGEVRKQYGDLPGVEVRIATL